MQRDGGPGGAGGAGNPASFTGTASTLDAMGRGVWAGWSGQQPTSNETLEAFNFLSPNKGLIFELGWVADFASLTSGRYLSLEVKLNGTSVIFMRGQLTSANDFPVSFPYSFPPLVVPAQSDVLIIVGTNEDAAVDQYVTIVGREI